MEIRIYDKSCIKNFAAIDIVSFHEELGRQIKAAQQRGEDKPNHLANGMLSKAFLKATGGVDHTGNALESIVRIEIYDPSIL